MFISTKTLDRDFELHLYETIRELMLHGPCGGEANRDMYACVMGKLPKFYHKPNNIIKKNSITLDFLLLNQAPFH